jgi:hypothetical protein
MTGTLTTFDVSDWHKEQELLTFLSDIRNVRLQRTKLQPVNNDNNKPKSIYTKRFI